MLAMHPDGWRRSGKHRPCSVRKTFQTPTVATSSTWRKSAVPLQGRQTHVKHSDQQRRNGRAADPEIHQLEHGRGPEPDLDRQERRQRQGQRCSLGHFQGHGIRRQGLQGHLRQPQPGQIHRRRGPLGRRDRDRPSDPDEGQDRRRTGRERRPRQDPDRHRRAQGPDHVGRRCRAVQRSQPAVEHRYDQTGRAA